MKKASDPAVWKTILVGVLLAAAAAAPPLVYLAAAGVSAPPQGGLTYLLWAAVGVLAGATVYLYLHLFLALRRDSSGPSQAVSETADLQGALSDSAAYDNLIKISCKYLDQYYLQTREQAQRGFAVTVAVSLFGALLITAGVAAMFLGVTTTAYVTSASGIITQFISAVFFYLYNKTVARMGSYHTKLLMTQNISIALAAADSLPEDQQADAKKEIIGELIKNLNETYITGQWFDPIRPDDLE